MPKYSHEHLTGEMPESHRNQTILMIVFFVVWGADSFLLRLTTFLWNLNYFWIFLGVGAVIIVVAAYFMNASHKDLFDAHVEGLATEGVFGRVRHPMYLGTHLFYLGLAIATFSLVSIALWVLIFAFYNTLANYEERKLEERFGEQFQEYKSEVRKWIPL
jgi:protein-S-isoprenylcysteine O-methyltransferase Ste14